jgi:hypothetical protein
MVRVLYKDALEIEGSTLVYIIGQGHMFKWRSEKLEELKKNPLPKNSKFDKHKDDKEDTNDEGDKEEDSSGRQDSGFARLGRARTS